MKATDSMPDTNWVKGAYIPKYLIIDEMSMIGTNFYNIFGMIKENRPNTKFIFLGDFNQIPPVNEEHIDFSNTYFLKMLCGNEKWVLTKQYRQGKCALPTLLKSLTKKWNDELTPFIKKHIPINDNIDEMVYSWNICYNNANHKDGAHINKVLNERHWVLAGEDRLAELDFGKIIKGMKIISKTAIKKLKINNNSIMTITDLSGTDIITKDRYDEEYIIPLDLIKKFNLAYCITAHKSQGQTLKGKIFIHQLAKLCVDDYKMVYTAMGRATSMENVFLVNKV